MLMKGMQVDLCINLLAFPSLFIFKNKLFYFNLKNRSHTPSSIYFGVIKIKKNPVNFN